MIDNKSPLVTVLMPVFNGEKYVRESIESILNQTFTDFEFLIINDGSTDNSKEIILSYDDKRIRYVENEKNLGLNPTLNIGLNLSNSKYIARMDCDDISLPRRLERQVDFMEKNLNIGICGTHIKTFDSFVSSIWKTPETHEEIKCKLLFHSSMNHPTVMFRKSIVHENNLHYHKDYLFAEDYELWFSSCNVTRLANIPEVLLNYRIHEQGVSKVFSKEYLEHANKVRKSMLIKIIPVANEEEINFHLEVAANLYNKSDLDLKKVMAWFGKLLQGNNETKYLDSKSFNKFLSEKWVEICIYNRKFGLLIKSLFGKNSFSIIDMLSSTIKIVYRYIVK